MVSIEDLVRINRHCHIVRAPVLLTTVVPTRSVINSCVSRWTHMSPSPLQRSFGYYTWVKEILPSISAREEDACAVVYWNLTIRP